MAGTRTRIALALRRVPRLEDRVFSVVYREAGTPRLPLAVYTVNGGDYEFSMNGASHIEAAFDVAIYAKDIVQAEELLDDCRAEFADALVGIDVTEADEWDPVLDAFRVSETWTIRL